MEIPYMELEEWRAQVIDTLFDVYANEKFDDVFMDFGFVGLLEQAVLIGKKQGKGGKGSKGKGKFVA